MACFKSCDNRLNERSGSHSGVDADHRLTPKVPASVTGNVVVGGYCVIPILGDTVNEISLVGVNDGSSVGCCGRATVGVT